MIIGTYDVKPIETDHLLSVIQQRVWLDRLYDHPGFQTNSLIGEPAMLSFVHSFVEGANSLGFNSCAVNLWAYCDTRSRQEQLGYDTLWHSHTNNNQVLCGVLYLVNPEQVGTQFSDGETTDGQCWKWHYFLPEKIHRAGKLATDKLRISLAGDLLGG